MERIREKCSGIRVRGGNCQGVNIPVGEFQGGGVSIHVVKCPGDKCLGGKLDGKCPRGKCLVGNCLLTPKHGAVAKLRTKKYVY